MNSKAAARNTLAVSGAADKETCPMSGTAGTGAGPTPYPELNQVLRELVSRIQEILGNDFVGAYLQGSFAVGDFDRHSDVDFIAVVEDELTPDQVDALQVMHGRVYEQGSEWAKHLEGSYFPRAILRQPSKRGLDLWYLDHGARSLIRSDHCNTSLVRWVVREQGVRLAGPPAKTLVDPISEEALRAEIFDTLTDWGQQILDDPTPYHNRFYQGFIVLNYCRMLHDLHRGYPGSKRDGAEWAKSVLDPSWSDLIDRAWACRPDPARQVRRPPDREDFERTLRLVKHVMDESAAYVSDGDRSRIKKGMQMVQTRQSELHAKVEAIAYSSSHDASLTCRGRGR